jgi:hypothetical protein
MTLFVMIWGLAAAAAAQDDAPQARVARLIPLLGSDSYAERRLATEELEKMGAAAREQLKAEENSTNPEVRRRARDLLAKLRLADLWEPSRVTIQAERESAAKVLARLAEQSGNRVAASDHYASCHDVPVTISATSAPFWSVLDDLCRQSGNLVRAHYDHRRPGFVVVAGSPGKFPLAYAGPVRGRVTGARRVFTEELDHETGKTDVTHNFQINLQFTWEDRFRLVAYRSHVELADAITDTGRRVPATGSGGGDWEAASESTRQVTMPLALQPPPIAAQKLDVLRVRWGMIAVGDMATLEVTDFTTGKSHTQDDLRLTVQEFEKLAAARYRLTLVVNRDLALPEPRSVAFHENEFDLHDVQGQPLRKMINGWRLTDEGLRIQATFTQEAAEGANAGSPPKVLRFSYPRIRSQRDLEIIFRDVPLPTAQPE